MDWKERAQQLVDQHWDYHDVIIPIFLKPTYLKAGNKEIGQSLENWGEWYKQIGLHFYKHAIEDIKSGKVKI